VDQEQKTLQIFGQRRREPFRCFTQAAAASDPSRSGRPVWAT
jgi:hypothetical protein